MVELFIRSSASPWPPLELVAAPDAFGANEVAVRRMLEELAHAPGTRSIALDLGQVPWLSTRAIRTLVELKLALAARGGRLELRNVGAHVRRTLESLHLEGYLLGS